MRENKQDSTAASIPVADIYSANGGITVGDASTTRREVHTPIEETLNSAQISIKWPGKTIAANTTVEAGESFVAVHKGDYGMMKLSQCRTAERYPYFYETEVRL